MHPKIWVHLRVTFITGRWKSIHWHINKKQSKNRSLRNSCEQLYSRGLLIFYLGNTYLILFTYNFCHRIGHFINSTMFKIIFLLFALEIKYIMWHFIIDISGKNMFSTPFQLGTSCATTNVATKRLYWQQTKKTQINGLIAPFAPIFSQREIKWRNVLKTHTHTFQRL